MSKTLANLLKKKKTLIVPGVFNAITARLCEKIGFEGIYLSGAGVSNSLLGMPDIGLISLPELEAQVRYITRVVKIPLIVDADTGFAKSSGVIQTVRNLESAGASAIQIEDQAGAKKCGHLEGKRLIPKNKMIEKIKMAVDARKNRDFLIIARTDARGVEGLESAVDRAMGYAQAGADIIFPEALQSQREFKTFREALKIPLMANMTEFGKTPYISVLEFQKLGYHLVIFPMTAFRVMMKAAQRCLIDLKSLGSQKKWLSKMQTRKELYDLIDYQNF